jgi:phosphate acetyltransferase
LSAFLASLRQRAAAQPRRIVFPEGADERTLAAVVQLQRDRLVEPVVLGNIAQTRAAVTALGGDAEQLEIIDPARDARQGTFLDLMVALRAHRRMSPADAAAVLRDPLMFGALLVRTGEVHGSVAGAARSTADVVRASIWCVGSPPGTRTVSSSFYMVVPPFRGQSSEVLTFTDAGIVAEPTAAKLCDIAQAAASARRTIVGDGPIVAFLSFATHGSGEGPSVARVRQAVALFRERMPDVPADGELQVDAALIEAVATQKAPGSAAAGHANVLVFPSLDAGNIAYKLVQRLANAEAIGPILQGLARPCNDLSRGADVADIVNVACITAVQE